MDCYVTLTLLVSGFSLSSCSYFPPRKYYYVNLNMNWTDAQHYCREKYTDLATIASMDDISRLQSDISYSWAWIGLSDDPKSWKEMGNDSNSWRWSATGETSKTSYQNWAANRPNGIEECVIIGPGGTWYDVQCESIRSFVCYNDNKTYVFISTLKTWSDARDYCREYYTDLPVIENKEENDGVNSTKPPSVYSWIGLYRVPWTWSDKTQSSFTYWRSSSPNHVGGNQFCVCESTLHVWDDDTCSIKYPFVCHQDAKLKTIVKLEFETDADLTDPATNSQILQQLGAVLTSQGWTDFELRWKIQPRKQEKLRTEPQCV